MRIDQVQPSVLKVALRRTQRRRRLQGFGLTAPLLIFLLASFLVPIGVVLFGAVYSPELSENMPLTVAALRQWDRRGIPDEATFAALAADLRLADEKGTLARVGRRLNYAVPGMRSLFMSAGRAAADMKQGPYKKSFTALDPAWGQHETWVTIAQAAQPYTPFFLLAALDLRQDSNGHIVRTDQDQAIFIPIFVRTIWISALVTLICAALGYPVAFFLASLPPRTARRLTFFVLLPFWTSLLVRTLGWIVLLQREGVINSMLQSLGIIGHPLGLIYNLAGVLVAMVHILLPFMILPVYSVMKSISPSYMRAASSLGAPPLMAFMRVYFPQTIPGLGAGCLLVFIQALGYYIAPALVGGPSDQMASYFIAQYINVSVNWSMASALSVILLLIVMVFYLIYYRVVGIDRLRLG